MLSVRSTANESAAAGSISGETGGGKTLRNQIARAPQIRKQMPVNSVNPRLTSPRACTQNSAIVPPTAASNRRRNAACGSACTSADQLQRSPLSLPYLLGLIRPGVVVLEAQGHPSLGRRGLEDRGSLVGRRTQSMALSNGDVVAHARLHVDFVELTV